MLGYVIFMLVWHCFVFKESLKVNSLNLNAVCVSAMLNIHESSKAFNYEIGES